MSLAEPLSADVSAAHSASAAGDASPGWSHSSTTCLAHAAVLPAPTAGCDRRDRRYRRRPFHRRRQVRPMLIVTSLAQGELLTNLVASFSLHSVYGLATQKSAAHKETARVNRLKVSFFISEKFPSKPV
jgi:hypothetical protein